MRIAIVNDLLVAVEALRRVVTSVPEHSIAWVARDGADAVRRCAIERPDLILMDIVMPVMDGAESTRRIMSDCPTSILVVTSTVGGNFAKVFEAMGFGALDAVKTPELGRDGSLVGGAALLAKIDAVQRIKNRADSASLSPSSIRPAASVTAKETPTFPLVAIGASTGGPQAIADVLSRLPHDLPAAVAICQHITADFTPGLASWLSEIAGRPVKIARAGESPRQGEVVLAGTNNHLTMAPGGSWRYDPEPLDIPYRPSVDVLFDALAHRWKTPGVGVLLTGMGCDGAKGLKKLKDKGWFTIAQDERSSIVYGMPAAAVQLAAATRVLPLSEIGAAVNTAIRRLGLTTP